MSLKILFWTVALFSSILFCVQGDDNGWELQLANVVYRHGDRSPEETFPNDEHRSYWKQGLGQLTEIGMSQEFVMGQFLKKRYLSKLINQTYLRKQVYCRSSNKDRTLMSAEAQMAGLYPPKIPHPHQKEWRFWQLVPIHTVPKEYDQLLRPYSYNCPRLREIEEESFKDPKYAKMVKKNKRFINRVSKNLGLSEPLTLNTIFKAYDMFFCQRAHNISWPKWLTQHDFDRLGRLRRFDFDWMFKSPEKSRLTGGNLLGEMVENMKKFIKNPLNKRKLYVYSGHDTTIAALLSALKVYSGITPPYSTAFLMELYKKKRSGKRFVKMYLRNDTSLPDTTYELVIPRCQGRKHGCPLHRFIRSTRSAVPEDFEAECNSKQLCSQSSSKKHAEMASEGDDDLKLNKVGFKDFLIN